MQIMDRRSEQPMTDPTADALAALQSASEQANEALDVSRRLNIGIARLLARYDSQVAEIERLRATALPAPQPGQVVHVRYRTSGGHYFVAYEIASESDG